MDLGHFMKRFPDQLYLSLGCTLVLIFSLSVWLYPDTSHSVEEKAAPGQPVNQAWRVVIDPATGARLQEPPAALPGLAATSGAALPRPETSTSSHGVRELPGTSKAGGIKLDLGEGFYHYTTVTRDAQGQAHGHCLQTPVDATHTVSAQAP